VEAVYDAIRKVQLVKVQLTQQESILDGMQEKVTSMSPPETQKVTKKERVLELVRDVEAGMYPTLKSACEDNEISYPYARNVVSGRR